MSCPTFADLRWIGRREIGLVLSFPRPPSPRIMPRKLNHGWYSETFMTFKRKAISALSRTELLEVGRALELDVTTNMRLDDLMDVVAGSKKRGMMEKILPVLTRDTPARS